ncbi:3-demethylubiquinone-9 3-methyltransferase [Niveomyces insectorum RCEF 264]|uniref:Ubiquinone biosynthesis O-methyltransferase, mitochondrial n=1 Tax=Niveomyces insectorum RCEF 264 TaxID=1081102 RepID=A0A167TXY5_9HYPO|nr:3-demethylubiquinone-9 3-methyltransferase [Niveomyces insectorum RCEF 264]
MAAPRAAAAPILRRACCTHMNKRCPTAATAVSRRFSPARVPRRTHTTSSASSASSASSSSPSSSSSSVSPDEVAHFNALASTWWDPYGPSRLLHQMNPLRHDFIRTCVQQDDASPSPSPSPSSSSVSSVTDARQLPRHYLDVGCGGGIFAESAARLPTTMSVTAIDPSAAVLAVARAHAQRDPVLQQRLQYRQAAIEDLSNSSSSSDAAATARYDVVTLFEVLEHVATDPATFLAQCGRLVRPGGWLVLSTMARTWASWLTTVLVAEDVLGIVPRGTHDWRKYVNADELRAYFAPGAPAAAATTWQRATFQGVMYVPGLGWQVVPGGEQLGNYFFGIQKAPEEKEEEDGP